MNDTSTDKQERLIKLVRQAEHEGTGTAEAELFIARAQKEATRLGLDFAVVVAQARASVVKPKPATERFDFGRPAGSKGLYTMVQLAVGIAQANNVKVNIAFNSTAVVLFGFQTDIDVVKAMFSYLRPVMEEQGRAYAQGKPRPLATRLEFQNQFALTIGSRLRAEAEKSKQEWIQAQQDTEGGALVPVSRSEEVDQFYKATSTARGTYRGGRNTQSVPEARAAAHSAARNVDLAQRASLGGSRRALS